MMQALKSPAKREKFAALVASGESQAAALRAAHAPARKWAEGTVWAEASRLAAEPAVRARIDELRRKAAEENELTVTQHLRDLQSLREEARAAGVYSAAVSAEVARGKAAGLYEQRATVKVQGLDWRALLGGRPGEDEQEADE